MKMTLGNLRIGMQILQKRKERERGRERERN
jgi:hypothetical protein